jgi:general secretion pathway protein E
MLIGEILIKKNQISPKDIERGLQYQAKYGGALGSILLNMGIISEEMLVLALAEQLNLQVLKDGDRSLIDFNSLKSLSNINIFFLAQRGWFPINEADGKLYFGCANPLDYEVNQYLANLNIRTEIVILTQSQLREIEGDLRVHQKAGAGDESDFGDISDNEIDRLREMASEAPIINMVNSLISRAVERGASDLHFEPYNKMYRVRFRIDGMLHDIDFLPMKMQLPIASRIKILSGMDIAESRKPQDGQISMRISSKEIDVRVSTLPLAKGESLVLRFLVKESVGYELSQLGLEPDLTKLLNEDIVKTAGVILLTGPTGSGKTTTLYSCLNRINSEEKKIITIEDPVEYQLEGINQIQVRPEIGYDFLSALRSILRQDPDVIMIGEIRDGETARVAMQSSLTGHLVFSTVHTNDAPTAYTRLLDLGLPEFLINSSLISVIAQRLARQLCLNCSCSTPVEKDIIATYHLEELATRYGIKSLDIRNAVGCELCSHTGYKGRIGLMEYLRCNSEIKSMPKDDTFPVQARAYMQARNVRSLVEDGLLKVIRGLTTFEEVYRVCG